MCTRGIVIRHYTPSAATHPEKVMTRDYFFEVHSQCIRSLTIRQNSYCPQPRTKKG
jgi:hypothetical protein